jgi:hypothetical protein
MNNNNVDYITNKLAFNCVFKSHYAADTHNFGISILHT